MTQNHTTNEVTYEGNAAPTKKVSRKIDVGMLSLSEVTTSITEPRGASVPVPYFTIHVKSNFTSNLRQESGKDRSS